MFQALMTMAGASVRQLQESQARLLRSVAPATTETKDYSQFAQLPMLHLGAFHSVLGSIASRQVQLGQKLLTSAFRPAPGASMLVDALQLQQAIVQRLMAQQTQFMDELAEIAAGAAHIKKANTLSKLMDQEYDLFSQFSALLSAQATAFMELMESAEIGFGVLLSRRLEGKPEQDGLT